mmetsp:Transcript_44000/g.103447  ORF Transcript_44000/g.103447 Transcript_44000/m.103447 type:complete len:216 (+) Transcript_44000:175-822(+)
MCASCVALLYPLVAAAFYSPWFGMDPGDNLNLIQPVNPWFGSSWSMYTEYFQWSPEHNSNSDQYSVKAGQTLHGSLVYDSDTDSYDLTQEIVETGDKSTQNVKCQDGKKYTVPYVVFEKLWSCKDYPADGKVHFHNIVAECDGKDCAKDIKWAPKVKDANCDMKAVINSDGTIDLTWDTSLESRMDNVTAADAFDMNYHGWATSYPLTRPMETVV